MEVERNERKASHTEIQLQVDPKLKLKFKETTVKGLYVVYILVRLGLSASNNYCKAFKSWRLNVVNSNVCLFQILIKCLQNANPNLIR